MYTSTANQVNTLTLTRSVWLKLTQLNASLGPLSLLSKQWTDLCLPEFKQNHNQSLLYVMDKKKCLYQSCSACNPQRSVFSFSPHISFFLSILIVIIKSVTGNFMGRNILCFSNFINFPLSQVPLFTAYIGHKMCKHSIAVLLNTNNQLWTKPSRHPYLSHKSRSIQELLSMV